MAAPRTKLFVGHLPDGCSNEDLQSLFEKYGSVMECDVINKYGFVHMSTSEEADEAIKNLNNFEFRGSSLSVERSKSKLHPEPGAPGRAKGGMPSRGRGMPYGGYRGNFSGGYTNGVRRFDGPQYGGGGDYYNSDRGYGEMNMAGRMRPYPMPFERRGPSMGPPRDDYAYRPSPYQQAPRDPYARPISTIPPRSDLYERRPTAYPSASDYLYSRREPSQIPTTNRPHWYDTAENPSPRPIPTAAARQYY